MKILFLTDQMHLHGGIERILSQKINYLIDFYQHDVFLITTEQKNIKPVYELESRLKTIDLAINYHRSISYFHPKNILKTLLHFYKLYFVINKIKPDVIVSVSTSPEQYLLPFIHKKIPKLKEFHSSRFGYKENKNWKQKLDKTLNLFENLIVLNADEKKYYSNKNITIIPNFTDFECLENSKIVKEKTIIAAGRIAPVKQFDELIKIWAHIAAKNPDWSLKIYGNGDLQIIEQLQQLIKTNQLAQSVLVLPATSNLKTAMRQASIYAMTSSSECFPMVLLEAQASGLPIISYNCPTGPKHIVADKQNGFLIEPNDQLAFATQLQLLINDNNLQNKLRAQAQLNVINFKKEKIMQKWH